MIKTEITEATSSMTSVPKPLKFLTPEYSKLVDAFKKYSGNDTFKVSDHFEINSLSIIWIIEKPLRSLFSDRNGGGRG
jgi:hypothetical protein